MEKIIRFNLGTDKDTFYQLADVTIKEIIKFLEGCIGSEQFGVQVSMQDSNYFVTFMAESRED